MCFVVAGRIRYLDLICICLLCLALMVCADFTPPPPRAACCSHKGDWTLGTPTTTIGPQEANTGMCHVYSTSGRATN